MEGIIRKMEVEHSSPVNYFFNLNNKAIPLNKSIGKGIKIHYTGEIHCLNCGRLTKKSFAQGYCYPCFISIPQTDECILHPEKCQAHLGISRDMEWSKEHCLQDHFVYLALSSGLKVGVTRKSQIPTRWIDQGAKKAIKLAKTPNRNLAGLIEVSLKLHLADKTNWRNMLTNKLADVDLSKKKKQVQSFLDKEYTTYIEADSTVFEFDYPVERYPEKVKSINLEKTPEIEKVLTGIKGQYLIFEDQSVINIRKYGGYKIQLEI